MSLKHNHNNTIMASGLNSVVIHLNWDLVVLVKEVDIFLSFFSELQAFSYCQPLLYSGVP